MASPLTAVSMVATAAGGILQAQGINQEANASASMYRYQAGIARMNRDVAKSNADYARKAGEAEAQQYGMRSRARMGDITTHQAASGLDVNSDSYVGVRESQAAISQQDQAMIRSNAARRAFGFETEAANQEAQSNIYLASARNVKRSAQYKRLASIIGTAGSLSSRWMQANQIGIGSSGGGGGTSYAFGSSDIGGGG